MMLSIKAICKSENNEEVVIIGFELEGYCLCMTKSGTIFHAKHEDLTIVDKEYMEAFAKEIIDFEMADFLEKASARLDQIQSKQLTSIILELQEYRSKIEGAVVLTREEYDGKGIVVEMSGGHKLKLSVGKFSEMSKILEEHTRKETAEKFAERVKMSFYYEFDELIPSIMADKIDEICKEITEGK